MADVKSIPFEELGEPDGVLWVGDTVMDCLTGMRARVVRIQVGENQTAGIWLDNDWAGGGRHPWEISLLRSENQHSAEGEK